MLEKSEARIANEDSKRGRLAAGELGLDIYDMRPKLEAAGFEYVEDLDTLGSFNGIDCRRTKE